MNKSIWENRLKIYGFRDNDIIDMYCEDVVNIDNIIVGMENDNWTVHIYKNKGIMYLTGRRY